MSLRVHPKRLAEALENAALFSTDKAGLEVNDTIAANWTGETLRFMGRGKYSASVQDLRAEGDEEEFSIILDRGEATELAALLKKSEGAGRKDTKVDLHRTSDDEVAIISGETLLGYLRNVPDHEDLRSTEEFEGLYELVERAVVFPELTPPTNPIVWTRGVLNKLNKVRLGQPAHDADRWEAWWIGGATWRMAMVAEDTVLVALMESTRDGLE